MTEIKQAYHIEYMLRAMFLVTTNEGVSWVAKRDQVRSIAAQSPELDAALAEFLSWFDHDDF